MFVCLYLNMHFLDYEKLENLYSLYTYIDWF